MKIALDTRYEDEGDEDEDIDYPDADALDTDGCGPEWRTYLYLIPAAENGGTISIVTYSGLGNVGTPAEAVHGRWICIGSYGAGVVGSSVLDALHAIEDEIVAASGLYLGAEWDGSNYVGRWDCDDPDDLLTLDPSACARYCGAEEYAEYNRPTPEQRARIRAGTATWLDIAHEMCEAAEAEDGTIVDPDALADEIERAEPEDEDGDDDEDDDAARRVRAALSDAEAEDGRSMLDVAVDACVDMTLVEIERELSRMGYSRVEYTRRPR